MDASRMGAAHWNMDVEQLEMVSRNATANGWALYLLYHPGVSLSSSGSAAYGGLLGSSAVPFRNSCEKTDATHECVHISDTVDSRARA